MAVELLRKLDDGTMEKLDIGGEVDLDGYAKLDVENEFTTDSQYIVNNDGGVNQGWKVNKDGFEFGLVSANSASSKAYGLWDKPNSWAIRIESGKIQFRGVGAVGDANTPVYFASNGVVTKCEFNKMTTTDVDALFD